MILKFMLLVPRNMILKKSKSLILLVIILLLYCQGEDTIGKIIIEYDGDWSATIVEHYNETSINGTGKEVITYINPDSLSITATKQDASWNKLTIYIYEDERIVAGESTREPEGSINAEYEYPY